MSNGDDNGDKGLDQEEAPDEGWPLEQEDPGDEDDPEPGGPGDAPEDPGDDDPYDPDKPGWPEESEDSTDKES